MSFLINEINEKYLDLDICLSCAFLNPISIEHIKDQELQYNCLIEYTQFISSIDEIT